MQFSSQFERPGDDGLMVYPNVVLFSADYGWDYTEQTHSVIKQKLWGNYYSSITYYFKGYISENNNYFYFDAWFGWETDGDFYLNFRILSGTNVDVHTDRHIFTTSLAYTSTSFGNFYPNETVLYEWITNWDFN